MNASVVTSGETHAPFIYYEFADGQLTQLQFGRVPAGEEEVFVTRLREVLSDGLAAHGRALLDDFAAQMPAPTPEQVEADEVLRRARQHMAKRPSPARPWRNQADGRDPSGEVHVSVAADQLVILELPADLLEAPQKCGWAIRDALNLALRRQAQDFADHLAMVAPRFGLAGERSGTRLV